MHLKDLLRQVLFHNERMIKVPDETYLFRPSETEKGAYR